MNKSISIILFCFMGLVFVVMAYPLYSVFRTVSGTKPPSFHEYTVLDLETGKKMIVTGDDNQHVYHANDTAWRNDRILFPDVNKAPDNAMQVVIIASYNQLYE